MQTLSIASIALMLLVTAFMATPFAFAQTNQTGTAEDKMKAASATNAMKATAPGDTVFVVICPKDFKSIDECQIFVGQPA